MKNIISYYYNIIFNDIHQNKDRYFFEYDKFKYFFIPFNEDVQSLQEKYKLHIELSKRNIPVHQIILNKEGKMVTFAYDKPYILLKVLVPVKKITLNDILFFSQINIENTEYDIKTLWEEKNDHLEYQITQIKNRYSLLYESFDYYIGLAENAIQILNKAVSYPKVISHKRINSNSTTFDLYNPLNIIIDSRIRDVAEYFKSSFFNNHDINENLENFLKFSRLTESEYYLFLARMFYPTYYFDMYENIIKGSIKEKEIKKITSKVSDYEKILKLIYNHYKGIMKITQIEWLETI